MIGRVDHQLLRLNRFVLNIHGVQLTANNLHRIRNSLRLHLALGALLPLDLNLGVLALQFLRSRQLQ